jgi:hypothetical protein
MDSNSVTTYTLNATNANLSGSVDVGGIISGNGSGLTNLIHGTTISVVSGITATPTQNPNGSTNYALTVTAGGSGTVTSVGLALPAEFTVTGSPVTGAGTLTGARTAGASANYVGQNATNFQNVVGTNTMGVVAAGASVDPTNVFQVDTMAGTKAFQVGTNGASYLSSLFVSGIFSAATFQLPFGSSQLFYANASSNATAIANGTGFLHDNGSGTFAWSTDGSTLTTLSGTNIIGQITNNTTGNAASSTFVSTAVLTNHVPATNVDVTFGTLATTGNATNYTVALLPGPSGNPLQIYLANTNVFITFANTNQAGWQRTVILNGITNSVLSTINMASRWRTNINYVGNVTNGTVKVLNFYNLDTTGTNLLGSPTSQYQ